MKDPPGEISSSSALRARVLPTSECAPHRRLRSGPSSADRPGRPRSACIRIDFDNAAEVGWYKDGSQQSLYVCDNTTTPHVFVWARTAGYNKCKPGTAAVTGSAAYRLENPAHDNTIEYFYNGNPQGFFSVAFTQGQSWSYSEHHTAGENLVVDWSSLRYLGNAGNWNTWPTITHWTTGDTSGFKRCPYGATHWAVKTSSATC